MSDFTDREIALIRELQNEIPLCPEPFAAIGAKVGLSAPDVLAKVKEWTAAGVIRRYGAAVRHYKMGYVSNAMSVWNVPAERVDEVGALFAARPEVSHCYERDRIPGFDYNVYAMIHGRERGEVDRVVQAMAEESGIEKHDVLWSVHEYKRDSMFYFVEDDD